MMLNENLPAKQCKNKYPSNKCPPKKGYTFLEVLIALTVLLAVCLVLFGMFHASLRYSANIKDESTAAVIAERSIEEIRAWAYTFDDGKKMYNFNISVIIYFLIHKLVNGFKFFIIRFNP